MAFKKEKEGFTRVIPFKPFKFLISVINYNARNEENESEEESGEESGEENNEDENIFSDVNIQELEDSI